MIYLQPLREKGEDQDKREISLINFKSVRMCISTINPENINVFKEHEVDDIKYDSSVSVLPFISNRFSDYKFESTQVIKRMISERLIKELIFDSFVSSLENSKIYSVVFKCVKNFIYKDFMA
jgi:hypothetical protein